MKAYLIYSMGKTGSTSLYQMVKRRGDIAIHTHGLYENHTYVSNLHKELDVLITDDLQYVIHQFGITEIKMVCSFRNPIDRRISGFVHDLNKDIISEEPIRFKYPPGKNVISHYLRHKELAPYELLRDLFLEYYIEYRVDNVYEDKTHNIIDFVPFFFEKQFVEELSTLLDISINFTDLFFKGSIQGNSSFFGVPTEYLFFKFENISSLAPMISSFLDFPTGTKLLHERNSNDFSYFSATDPKVLKERLKKECRNSVRVNQFMNEPLIRSMFYTF